ncbi:MAG: hypothetical protein NVV60_08205 [Luteimonas sp.]|nr:hypothetical protein [Luteimonas sp.]
MASIAATINHRDTPANLPRNGFDKTIGQFHAHWSRNPCDPDDFCDCIQSDRQWPQAMLATDAARIMPTP